MDGYDEKKEEEEPHFARLYAQMKGEYRDSLVIRQVSRSKSWKSTSWSGLREGGRCKGYSVYFAISLLLYCSILVVSCFVGSGALDRYGLLLSYSLIPLASPMTSILISTLF